MTPDELPETRWFRPEDLKRGPDGMSPERLAVKRMYAVARRLCAGLPDITQSGALEVLQHCYDEVGKYDPVPIPIYLISIDDARKIRYHDGLYDPLADQIVSEWFRDSCPECHGSGWADESRPCEHPRY